MDEPVIKYYRRLLKEGFKNAGSLESPSIFLDTAEEEVSICSVIGNYIHIFLNVKNDIIETIKYLCICDPTSNVAVEILCDLVKDKTLEAAATTTEESFLEELEGKSEELQKKAAGLMELFCKGLARYQSIVPQNNLSNNDIKEKEARQASVLGLI
ncbi:MAG: NifU protein [Thermoproteota archaeon]|nr:NifU protein [Thermoproteota archaeon]